MPFNSAECISCRYAESLASTRILKHSAESSRGNCGENLAWASYDQTGTNPCLLPQTVHLIHIYINIIAQTDSALLFSTAGTHYELTTSLFSLKLITKWDGMSDQSGVICKVSLNV